MMSTLQTESTVVPRLLGIVDSPCILSSMIGIRNGRFREDRVSGCSLDDIANTAPHLVYRASLLYLMQTHCMTACGWALVSPGAPRVLWHCHEGHCLARKDDWFLRLDGFQGGASENWDAVVPENEEGQISCNWSAGWRGTFRRFILSPFLRTYFPLYLQFTIARRHADRLVSMHVSCKWRLNTRLTLWEE